jgi:hypothetical protein
MVIQREQYVKDYVTILPIQTLKLKKYETSITSSLLHTLSGGFAKVSFKPLNQGSNNKKNQSWIVSYETGDWLASFSSCSRKVLGCFFLKSFYYF